jgi:hypothetical protein
MIARWGPHPSLPDSIIQSFIYFMSPTPCPSLVEMNRNYTRIAYHQYVTRPIISKDPDPSESTDATQSEPPLRGHLRINHPDVKDFSASILLDKIAETLVEPDDAAPGSSRTFVLVVSGDLQRDGGSTLYNSIFHLQC